MKQKQPRWWRLIGIWTLIALVVGVLGAKLGEWLGAPGYFGATVGFTLTGMVALFVFAATVARR